MNKDNEIILTADWGNELSDLIGKVVFSDTEKAKLFYHLLKEKPEIMSFGIGYIENTNTGETELIEVSCYVDMEKAATRELKEQSRKKYSSGTTSN